MGGQDRATKRSYRHLPAGTCHGGTRQPPRPGVAGDRVADDVDGGEVQVQADGRRCGSRPAPIRPDARSLKRRLRRQDYSVTMDQAFADVVRACAAPRRDETGTWLVPSMMRAYQRLYESGAAHSIEVWIDGALAGGLYGVAIGRMFFGESMFSGQTDGSKMALVMLAVQLARWGFPLIDCQMQTTHLATLGAIEIARSEFVRLVDRLVQQPPVPAPWKVDEDLIAQCR